MKIHCSIEIQRPCEYIFPWLAEPGKSMLWQKEVTGGKTLERKPGMVGTTFTETIEEKGSSLELRGSITSYVLNRKIAFYFESRIHAMDVVYALHVIRGGTRLDVDADIRWRFPVSIINALSFGGMARTLTRKMEAELFELKRLCGSGED
jgi:hypothetical protein